MTSIFIAVGCASVSSLAEPKLIYLGNDKAECNAAIAEAIEAKTFGRILRQNNPLMIKVSQEPAKFVTIDCSKEAHAKRQADAKAAEEAEAKAAEEAKALADVKAAKAEEAKPKKEKKKNEK